MHAAYITRDAFIIRQLSFWPTKIFLFIFTIRSYKAFLFAPYQLLEDHWVILSPRLLLTHHTQILVAERESKGGDSRQIPFGSALNVHNGWGARSIRPRSRAWGMPCVSREEYTRQIGTLTPWLASSTARKSNPERSHSTGSWVYSS